MPVWFSQFNIDLMSAQVFRLGVWALGSVLDMKPAWNLSLSSPSALPQTKKKKKVKEN